MILTEIEPSSPVRKAHREIFPVETKFPHHIDRERDQFGIGRRGGFPENVSIELIKFPKAPTLRFFVPETAPDLKPLEGFGITPLLGRGDPGKRGGEFRAQNNITTALVIETKELLSEFSSGLLQVEVGAFKNRSFVFRKSVSSGDAGPGLE